MKLLLLVPIIAVIAVNGLSTEKIHNGPQDYDSSDKYIQRKDMNLVDSNEDSTDNLQPLDIPDHKGHIEFELRNVLNKTAQPSGDCESNGGACKKNKQCNGTISIDYTCSKNGVCCIDEGKVKSATEMMIQILSNAILLQGIAIQTLKEEQENLFKNLTTTISNVANTISNQGAALQIMKSNLSDAISNQELVIQINHNSVMTNLSDGFSNVKNMLEIMEDKIMSRLDPVNFCVPETEMGENSILFDRIGSSEAAIKSNVIEANDNVTRDIKSYIHNSELAVMNLMKTQTNQINDKIENLSETQDYMKANLTKLITYQVPILIKPTKDTPKMNWADSVQRCTDMNAVPFIPRKYQDFTMIRSLRTSLGDYMWIPASDTSTEGQLQWWDGEVAMNAPGLEWHKGEHLFQNSNSYDCVSCNSGNGGAFLFKCSSTYFPMICQKN